MAGGEDLLVVAPASRQEEHRAWRTGGGADAVGGDDDDVDYSDDYGMLNFQPGFDGGDDDDDDGFPYETITMCVVVVFLAMCLYGLSKLILPYVPATWIHRGFLILRMHIVDVLVVAPGGSRDALLFVAQERTPGGRMVQPTWWTTATTYDYGMLNSRPGLDDGGDNDGDEDGFPYETITMCVDSSWVPDPAHAHCTCFEFLRMGKLY
uniref:Uncharacterized protein n=1 Tax=Oryza punctata TaxID=4537 RepID=A0A0E0MPU5_ORYPU